MIVSDSRFNVVYQISMWDKFTYPIYIDVADSLNRLNHFSSDERFQTLLLDKDNKVVAIGNPINNPKVKELYFKIIQGEKVERDKGTEVMKTKINIDKTSISLGRFDWQKEQKTTFTLKNAGDKPLVVQEVNTSCGCTSVSYSKEPVQPGGELKLGVTYTAEHPEHFNKTITVYCNTESSPLILKIMGDAE
jgi:glutathione peroxidase-family protein